MSIKKVDVTKEEQQGKDVFEYSIFGDASGQTKIGDFSA